MCEFMFLGLAVFFVILYFAKKSSDRRQEERSQEHAARIAQFDIETKQRVAAEAEQRKAAYAQKLQETERAVLHDKLIVLDVETQYLSDEIPGGWDSIPDFLLAVAVTWDRAHEFRVWREADAKNLIAEINNADQILTFNGNRFDFKVLSHYGRVKGVRDKSIDLCAFIKKHTRKRISLDSVAKATLGTSKSMSGIEAVHLWRTGDPLKQQEVVEYCKRDVEILRDIYVHFQADCLKFNGYDSRTYYLWPSGEYEKVY
jgi:uncharacterized protein YprB with RNaseH-like and TPR domain